MFIRRQIVPHDFTCLIKSCRNFLNFLQIAAITWVYTIFSNSYLNNRSILHCGLPETNFTALGYRDDLITSLSDLLIEWHSELFLVSSIGLHEPVSIRVMRFGSLEEFCHFNWTWLVFQQRSATQKTNEDVLSNLIWLSYRRRKLSFIYIYKVNICFLYSKDIYLWYTINWT
jgi:hypothetical protein